MEAGTYSTATLLGGANPLSQGSGTSSIKHLIQSRAGGQHRLRVKCAFALALSVPDLNARRRACRELRRA
jgi:hypothetical protein